MSPARGWRPGPGDPPSDLQLLEHFQPVAQQPWGQEPPADRLLAGATQLLAQPRIMEDLDYPLRALLHAGDQKPRLAIGDLKRDSTHLTAHERPCLPDRLGDGKSESLASRLLEDDVAVGLKSVDLDRAHVVEAVEDLDVRVPVGVGNRGAEEARALGIVR